VVDGKICFSLEEGVELLEIVKLYPIQKELISEYEKERKLTRKQRIKKNIVIGVISGCSGLIIGAAGTTILVIRLKQ
jgi:hypothetical protein